LAEIIIFCGYRNQKRGFDVYWKVINKSSVRRLSFLFLSPGEFDEGFLPTFLHYMEGIDDFVSFSTFLSD
jgi:hypothetical protein